MSATKLYTPEVLELATSLSQYPWDETLPLKGNARSKSCGSTVALALSTDADGRIESIGIKAHACAIGQAACALFARAAKGQSGPQIHAAGQAMESWLAGAGELPDWPGLQVLAPARDYTARHGAILLAWNAARDILPS